MGWQETQLPVGSVGFVNIPALVAVSATSLVTVPIGVSLAHSLDATLLKRAFGLYLLFISLLIFYRALT
jgi:uncharacterized membrane protein YfcA